MLKFDQNPKKRSQSSNNNNGDGLKRQRMGPRDARTRLFAIEGTHTRNPSTAPLRNPNPPIPASTHSMRRSTRCERVSDSVRPSVPDSRKCRPHRAIRIFCTPRARSWRPTDSSTSGDSNSNNRPRKHPRSRVLRSVADATAIVLRKSCTTSTWCWSARARSAMARV